MRVTQRWISLLLTTLMLAGILAAPLSAAGPVRFGMAESLGENSWELELYPVSGENELHALPTIYGNPQDVTVPASTTIAFFVAAGSGTITYQWQYLKPGATGWINVYADSGKTAVYTFKAEARHDGYQYRCKVTNSNGFAVSKTAKLTVINVPTIKTEPKNVNAAVGSPATLSLSATGSGTLSYRWQYSKDNGETWINVSSGGTSDTYTISSVAARHFDYLYHCVVSVANGGSVTSNNVKVIESTAALSVSIAPSSVTVTVGTQAAFKSTVSGGVKPYTYRWQYRKSSTGAWTNVSSNGTSATYTLTTAERHNGYQYHLIVTDSKGTSKTSGISTLYVNPVPVNNLTVKISPASNTVAEGTAAQFTSTVSGGTKPYTYRWQYRTSSTGSWTNVSTNGTSATYTLTAKGRHNGYQYRLIVKDANGSTGTSTNIATLNVTVPTKYRALVIGQNAYTSNPLKGCINDADGMKLMLTSLTNKYTVTEKTDLTASQIVASINSTFADATDNDVSLFYYSGHGGKDSGALVGVDNYGLWLDDLASMLSNIPGHVIVILDSCYSGMLLHSGREKEELARINENIIATFRKYDHGMTTSGLGDETNHSLTSSHFSVLTACAYNEESQEYYVPRGAFTDAFLEGLGHAFNTSTVRYQAYSGSMPADTSRNSSVNLYEAYYCAYNKVKNNVSSQTVQYYGTASRELFWH